MNRSRAGARSAEAPGRGRRARSAPGVLIRRRALLGAAAGATAGLLGGCGERANKVPFWFAYGGKNREALLALVSRFNTEQPQHALSPVFQGDYFELLAKLRTAIHAERAPALTQAGAFEGGDTRPLYAMPFNRSTPIAYINGSVLDELGLAPPTTWDELETFARAATRGSGADRRYGFSCPIDWWFWVAMVAQAGGDLVGPDGRFTLGGSAGVEAVRFMQRLVYELEVMRAPAGRDYSAWDFQKGEFLAGRVAMIWNSTAFVRSLEENAPFKVVCARLPKKVRFGVPTGGTLFVVPKGAPPAWREAAAAFLAFMARPDTSNEFATKTGYIPVTRAGAETLATSGYYETHANDRVALDQLADVRPWPWSKALFRVQREVVQSRLEACVLSRTDAEKSLAEALVAIEEGS